MEHLSLVSNLNLRRLIKDLLSEGGEGLYVHHHLDGEGSEVGDEREEGGEREQRDASRDYRFALVAEQILVLKVCRRENACKLCKLCKLCLGSSVFFVSRTST